MGSTHSPLHAYLTVIGSAALVPLVDGEPVIDWGQAHRRYNCHSIRKSLLNALIGIAVDRGEIDLTATLADLYIDDRPPLTDKEKRATVESLLKSRSGVYHWASYQPKTDRAHLPTRDAHDPDTHFVYNNWDFNALGTIYSQCTGNDLFNAFEQQIAVPLQMEDFAREENRYVGSEDSIHPAYVFRLSAHDLGRFGQLYLNAGHWRGAQIISSTWIKRSLQPYSHSPDGRAYGYLWWLANKGILIPKVDLPGGAFAAYGVGGHFVIVVPAYRLVLVHRFDSDQPNYRKLAPSPLTQGRVVKLILDTLGL